jgi:hypothetical protein
VRLYQLDEAEIERSVAARRQTAAATPA